MKTWKLLLTLAICFLIPTLALALIPLPTPSDPCDQAGYGDANWYCVGMYSAADMGTWDEATKFFTYSAPFNVLNGGNLPVVKKEHIAVGSPYWDVWLRQQKNPKDSFIGTSSEGSTHNRISLALQNTQKDALLIPTIWLARHRTNPTTNPDRLSWPLEYCMNQPPPPAPQCDQTSWRMRPSGGTPLNVADISKAEVFDHSTGLWITSRPMTDLSVLNRDPALSRGGQAVEVEYQRNLIYSMDANKRKWVPNGNTFGFSRNLPPTAHDYMETAYSRSLYIQWNWDQPISLTAGDDYYWDAAKNRWWPEENSFNYVRITPTNTAYTPVEYKFAITNDEPLPAIETTITETTYTEVKDPKDKSGKSVKMVATQGRVPNIIVRRIEDPNDTETPKRKGLVIQWPEPDALIFGVTSRSGLSIPNCMTQIIIGTYDSATLINGERQYVYTMLQGGTQMGTMVLSAAEWDLHKQRARTRVPGMEYAEITIQTRWNDNQIWPLRHFQNRGTSRGAALWVPFNDDAPISYWPTVN